MKNTISMLLFLFFTNIASAQFYDMKFPTSNLERSQKCQYSKQVFQKMPKEIKFSIKRKGDELYFEINDKNWFYNIFKNTGDGISIDVVSKSRYVCEEEVDKIQIRGTLLKPMYAQKLRRGLKQVSKRSYRVLVGKIPQELKEEELEFNILFLNNKNFCRYQSTYNLESYPWELLDMGVYLDSLTYKNKKIASKEDQFIRKYKTLKFTIPFEKNKSEYLPEDIKPMYDSLRLTDFNIKKIHIKAYSSVEGSLERNIKLQEQRANSIAQSLQSFQQPNITTKVTSSENWVEFLKDIQGTEFESLKSLSKYDIKKQLIGVTSQKLEPYLKNHRKAIISLELDKIDKYKDKSMDELITLFNTSVEQDALDKARVIQNSILEKVKEKVSPEALSKMRIPKQKKYVTLLNKNSITKFLINVSYSLIVKNELENLEKIDPKNKRVKYNLTVLDLVLWRNNALKLKENSFKERIKSLKKYGVTQNLIDRMLVNFHIIKAEKNLRTGKYEAKDESVEFITEIYDNFSMSNFDYLSLAQFLTYYSNLYDAIDLLEEKVQDLTIDEDLLFYYLNLTLIRSEFTQTDSYRAIMLNAINLNKNRFCKLFNPANDGGVTFQLLEDKYLKKTYCENCNK